VQRWLCRRQFLAGELKELMRWQAPPDPRVPRQARPERTHLGQGSPR
jgi:hypothetical protein